MDFGFSEEQDLLRGQARDVLDKHSDSRAVRALLDDERGYDPAVWKRMADLGWTSIPFPEEHGGLGLGLVDLVVVLEETGRHVTPSPLHASIGLFGMAVLRAATAAQKAVLLPGIADGSRRGTVAIAEESGRWDKPGSVRAERSGDAWLLSGRKQYVPDAEGADHILVAALTSDGAADGVTLLVVPGDAPGVTRERMRTSDQTQRLYRVRFDGVEVPAEAVVGEPDQGWSALQRSLDSTLVCVSAELCGVAQRAMEMSVEYARSRRQFGRPIGSFQAVSHKCADMLVLVESARSLTYHAAWAVDNGEAVAPMAAAMAKAYAGDAARQVTASGIQVHGGIGFTWEHDMHLFYKRARWGDVVYGDARHHRDRVADLLGL